MVEPATKIVRSFLDQEVSSMPGKEAPKDTRTKLLERGLWTQYICKVSDAVLMNKGIVLACFLPPVSFSVLN